MKNISLLIILVTMAFTITIAQPDKKMVDEALTTKKIDADTTKQKNWKSGGTFSLALSQQNSSFWIGSDENFTFTFGVNADLYSNYAKDKITFDNTLKGNYAFTNNSSDGVRKTADFVDLYSKLGRLINDSGTLALAFIFNARTQFTNSYDYDYLDQDLKRKTSGFAAPANVLITPGLDWRPRKYFSIFISPIAAKWVIVTNDPYSYYFPGGVIPPAYGGGIEEPLADNFGVDPAREVDFQLGAFLSAKFDKQFGANFSYTSRLDLYTNYLDEPKNIDVFWTNNLMYKLNKWLALTYQVNVAYDDEYIPDGSSGPRTQFLGLFGVGVTAKF